jgi:hypothetical protein
MGEYAQIYAGINMVWPGLMLSAEYIVDPADLMNYFADVFIGGTEFLRQIHKVSPYGLRFRINRLSQTFPPDYSVQRTRNTDQLLNTIIE